MPRTPPPARATIERLDFDPSHAVSSRALGHRSLLDDDVSLMSELADGIIERDRTRMRREVMRTVSFICAVLSWCVRACFQPYLVAVEHDEIVELTCMLPVSAQVQLHPTHSTV